MQNPEWEIFYVNRVSGPCDIISKSSYFPKLANKLKYDIFARITDFLHETSLSFERACYNLRLHVTRSKVGLNKT